jgi:hypothetical protein
MVEDVEGRQVNVGNFFLTEEEFMMRCGYSALAHPLPDQQFTDAQLDVLEERGYLDPDRRGDRAVECGAIESR